MQVALTNTFVGRLKPHAEPYEVRDTRLKGFLVRIQPSGHIAYYVQWSRGKRKSLGRADVLTADQARTKAQEALATHFMGGDPREKDRDRKRAIAFGKFLTEHYQPWAEANLRSGPSTVKRLESTFADLRGKELTAITAWDIDKWFNRRIKEGLKAATLNRSLTAMRGALSKAVDWGFLKSNPLSGVKKRKEDSNAPVRFLSDSEAKRLLATLNSREERIRRERDNANAWREKRGYDLLPDLRAAAFADHVKPMVLLSLHTGIRRGELFSLSWPDVNLEQGFLTAKGPTAKSGNTRHIPLNAVALETLARWREQSASSGLVFPAPSGGRFTNVRKSWDAVRRQAKIERFRWHDLRHTFASTLVMRGVDLATVRELMGHSDFALTLRYAHLQPEHRAAAVARLVGEA